MSNSMRLLNFVRMIKFKLFLKFDENRFESIEKRKNKTITHTHQLLCTFFLSLFRIDCIQQQNHALERVAFAVVFIYMSNILKHSSLYTFQITPFQKNKIDIYSNVCEVCYSMIAFVLFSFVSFSSVLERFSMNEMLANRI